MKNSIFILCIILLCCTIKENKINKQVTIPINSILRKNGVTIIFNKAPKTKIIDWRQDTILGGRPYLVNLASYRDFNGIVHNIQAKRTPLNDTVNISLKNKMIEIYFNQIALEGVSHLFRNGDTINVTYKNGKVITEILNRKTKPFDYRLNETLLKDSINLTPFEAFFRFLPGPRKEKNFNYSSYFKKWILDHADPLRESINSQKLLLDSLYKNNLLSKDIYYYQNNKLKYTAWSLTAKLKQIPYGNKHVEDQVFDDSKKINYSIFNKTNSNEINIQTIIKSGDSLLSYKFYQDFLNFYFLPNYIENQTTKTTFKYENFGGSNYDWGAVYDSIQKSNLFSQKVKNYQLYRYMEKIAKDLPPSIIDKYYKKFDSISDNAIYKDIINRDFKIDKSKTHKLVLNDTLSNEFYLEDILNKHKGNVIYLDFWASWCGPCIKSIPSLNQLRIDYANKKVKFITISTEQNFKEWKSSKSIKLKKDLVYNYILMNYYSSTFIKKNRVVYVPRYILIDKAGKIVNSNAPDPDDSNLRKLFNTYLAE